MNVETRERPSLARQMAGAAAIIVAVTVVGCRIYDAQVGANARVGQMAEPAPPNEQQGPPEGLLAEPKVGEVQDVIGALSPPEVLVFDESQFLSSSKSRVLLPKPVLPGDVSGEALLQSSKGMVLPDSAHVFLPSSKFVAIPPTGTVPGLPALPPVPGNDPVVRQPRNPDVFLPSSKSMMMPEGAVVRRERINTAAVKERERMARERFEKMLKDLEVNTAARAAAAAEKAEAEKKSKG